MSRYLAFVLLALSASSVLAAPAEIPVVPPVTVPDTSPVTAPVTGPVLGDRSGATVYSPNTLHKRDWKYPTSTKDCHVSQVSDPATTLSYTHEGQEYSEECLSHLALSVPFEKRESCRTTGTDAHGYDKECLFKKAFDEDWKIDLDKAKEAEVAYRSANSVASSDAWSKLYPNKISDCAVVEVTLGRRDVAGKKKGGEEKVVKGGKKDVTKSSDATSGWSPYFVTPGGDVLEIDCILSLVLGMGITLDGETCSAVERGARQSAQSSGNGLLSHLIRPQRQPTTVPATGQDDLIADIVGILEALTTDCLFDFILDLIDTLGLDAVLADDPLGTLITDLLDDVLADLTALLDGN